MAPRSRAPLLKVRDRQAPHGALKKFRACPAIGRWDKEVTKMKIRLLSHRSPKDLPVEIVEHWKTKDGKTLSPGYLRYLLNAVNSAATELKIWNRPPRQLAIARRTTRRAFLQWREKRATPLSKKDARHLLNDKTLQATVWAMLVTCFVTGSRYADARNAREVDFTKFRVKGKRVIRWEIFSLKSNTKGMVKFIPASHQATRLVSFLWKRARGRPDNSLPRTNSAFVFQISRARFVRALRNVTNNQTYSAHSPRRGAATRLANLGFSLEQIRKLLGHAAISTTRHYIGARPHQKESVELTRMSQQLSTAA